MVKKRVSRSSSKNKPISKKIIAKKAVTKKIAVKSPVKSIHKKRVMHLIVKKHARLPAAKELPIIATQEVKEQAVIEQPAVTPPIKAEEPKVEVPVEVKKVEIPSIFVDDTKVEPPNVEKKHDTDKIFRIIGKTIIGIVVLLFIIIFLLSIETSSAKTITKTTTTVDYVPINISYDKYMNLQNRSYVERVSLLGYLREDVTTSGPLKIYSKYIVDDYNNRIKLSLGYKEEQEFGKYFITNHTTDYTFNVSGTFRYGYDSYVLLVKNITNQKKPVIRQETVKVNDMTEMKRSLKINISRGIEKII
jgi:hypothetical protein